MCHNHADQLDALLAEPAPVCEKQGHTWDSSNHCVFCEKPRPAAPPAGSRETPAPNEPPTFVDELRRAADSGDADAGTSTLLRRAAAFFVAVNRMLSEYEAAPLDRAAVIDEVREAVRLSLPPSFDNWARKLDAVIAELKQQPHPGAGTGQEPA